MLPSATDDPFTFHFSLFTLSPTRRFALTGSLPRAVRRNLRSVAAGAHTAPTAPVILGRIVEKQVAAFVRAFSNQRWVCITEEIGSGLGKRR
jgi:hypothetical protein